MNASLDIVGFLEKRHPFDALSPEKRAALARVITPRSITTGDRLYSAGEQLGHVWLIETGMVGITDRAGERLSERRAGDIFGRRAALRDGLAPDNALCLEPGRVFLIPIADFARLVQQEPVMHSAFGLRERPAAARPESAVVRISDIMTRDPVCIDVGATVGEAAKKMRAARVSCLLVTENAALAGMITTRDVTNRVVAEGLCGDAPLRDMMTPDPATLPPGALVLDAVRVMTREKIGHLPVLDAGRLVGIITRTTLLEQHNISPLMLIERIRRQPDPAGIARVIAQGPQLLAQLVGAGLEPQDVTRLITDLTDAATERLLALGEEKLGPPPVPYLWLACGSQGRREQTGVSDQDNCLILHDDATPEHDGYFAALAQFVSDGLNAAGFVYCPGEMMATTEKWRQPRAVWRRYFLRWIEAPDTMAQMLASVMFDLRPIAGDFSLYEGLQAEVLEKASKNSIFVSMMVQNSLKHQPPLGFFGGLALIRSGEHKNALDFKHNGVVPITDLARVYALVGALPAVNTRERLMSARDSGAVSMTGGHDLIDALDMIAETRLRHQAAQIRRGEKPDNFVAPAALSELERGHLKDAFTVVKTMQAALGASRGGVM